MLVSLNDGPYRTGLTTLASFWDQYYNGRTISAVLFLDEQRAQVFSLAIFFRQDIVNDGKILKDLPAPRYGELAYLNQLGPSGNTALNITFSSFVPDLATWSYLSVGLFLSAAMIRRRKVPLARPLSPLGS